MHKYRLQILVPNIQSPPLGFTSSVSGRGNTLWQRDVEATDMDAVLGPISELLRYKEGIQQVLVTMIG